MLGAGQATADILLFLHADTQLPHHAKTVIEQALSNPRTMLGADLMCGFHTIEAMLG